MESLHKPQFPTHTLQAILYTVRWTIPGMLHMFHQLSFFVLLQSPLGRIIQR